MDLQNELARAITEKNGGLKAGQMARRLLENDDKGAHLIGLGPSGDAFIANDAEYTILRCPLDGERYPNMNRTEAAKADRWLRVEEWVEEREWHWLHPRFRWLVETG